MEKLNQLFEDFSKCPFSSIVISFVMIGVIVLLVSILAEDEKNDKK